MKYIKLLFAVLFFSYFAALSHAAPFTSTWLGGSGLWSDPAKWMSPSGIPGDGYQVLIANTMSASQVTQDIAAHLNNLAIASEASLSINSLLTAGTVQSFGSVNVSGGGVLIAGGFVQDLSSASTTIAAGGVVLDSDSWSQGNGSVRVNGYLSAPLFHVTGGSVTVGNGGIIGIGAGGYTQDLSVTTTVANGGQLSLAGAFSQGNGSLLVDGALSADLFHVTGGSVFIGANGTLTAGSGGYTQGSQGTATTIASGAQLTVLDGDYSQEIGTSTLVDGTLSALSINNSGMIAGTGSINGSVANLGALSAGDEAPGQLGIMGDYSQTGFLDIDIGGQGLASLLAVSGTASLGGTLEILLTNAFVPSLGDKFLVMTYRGETGQYYNVTGSGVPHGDFWQATYDPTALYVTLERLDSTPEPASFLMFGMGLAVFSRFGAARRKRQKRA